MDLVKWDPFRELDVFRKGIGRWFGTAPSPWSESGLEGWAPAVDILEDDKAITIKVELPEVDKRDIEVNVQDDVLTVRGERKLEKEEKKDHYRRIERSYGSFSRSFTLPDHVDQKTISAESKDGILRITLRKIEPSKPKKQGEKIPVK